MNCGNPMPPVSEPCALVGTCDRLRFSRLAAEHEVILQLAAENDGARFG